MTQLSSQRRDDIQLLRAVSVIAVCLYHAEVGFPSGFAGVDIFFVISGYVVTVSHFQITNGIVPRTPREFLLRRATRILPASLIVMSVTLAVSVLTFSPYEEFDEVLRSGIAAGSFSSNIYYLFQDTYDALKLDPFRHYWSLAVEEQFYILFFSGLLFINRIHKEHHSRFENEKRIRHFAIFLLSISLVLTGVELYLTGGKVDYFSPIRAIWQLLSGVLLAARHLSSVPTLSRNKRLTLKIVGGIGVLLVFAQVSSTRNWPALLTIVLTLSVLLLLHGGATAISCEENSYWLRKQLIRVGDLSYEIYLIHWPILVFLEKLFPTKDYPKWLGLGFTFLCAVALKSICRQFLWSEVVHRDARSTWLRLSGIGLTCILVFLSGAFISATNLGLQKQGFNSEDSSWLIRNQQLTTYNKSESFATSHGCLDAIETEYKFCKFPSESAVINSSAVLVGDSQARSSSDGFIEASQHFGYRYISWASGCPFMVSGFPHSREECRVLNASRLEQIANLQPTVVVIANLSSRYVSSDLPFVLSNDDQVEPDVVKARYIDIFAETIQRVTELGSRVVVISDIPLPPRGSGSPTLFRPKLNQYFLKRESEISELIFNARLKKSKLVEILRPESYLCNQDACRLYQDGSMNYSDDDHLSVAGSLLLAPPLAEMMKDSR